MTIKHGMESLRRGFAEVAALTKVEYPKLWKKAVSGKMLPGDEEVVFALTRPVVGLNGSSLLEVAQEHGEDAAIYELGRLQVGGYA